MSTLTAIRGVQFAYTFTLTGDWTGAHFSEVAWTARTDVPSSSVADDSDAVATATMTDGEITFSDAVGTLTLSASVTRSWPTATLVWDMKGVVAATGAVERIGSGLLVITGDITRSI